MSDCSITYIVKPTLQTTKKRTTFYQNLANSMLLSIFTLTFITITMALLLPILTHKKIKYIKFNYYCLLC